MSRRPRAFGTPLYSPGLVIGMAQPSTPVAPSSLFDSFSFPFSLHCYTSHASQLRAGLPQVPSSPKIPIKTRPTPGRFLPRSHNRVTQHLHQDEPLLEPLPEPLPEPRERRRYTASHHPSPRLASLTNQLGSEDPSGTSLAAIDAALIYVNTHLGNTGSGEWHYSVLRAGIKELILDGDTAAAKLQEANDLNRRLSAEKSKLNERLLNSVEVKQEVMDEEGIAGDVKPFQGSKRKREDEEEE